jgi:acyl-homoserine lactone acylase PvdQ
MDIFRRNARGELSEVFGPATLEEDKRHRTVGFAQVADAEAAQASPAARAILDAYADGVNAYIASLDSKTMPPEFQLLQYKPKPWRPADSLLVVKNFFEALSSTWRLDIMRAALADLPAEKKAAILTETSPIDVLVVGSDRPKKPTLKTAFVSSNARFKTALVPPGQVPLNRRDRVVRRLMRVEQLQAREASIALLVLSSRPSWRRSLRNQPLRRRWLPPTIGWSWQTYGVGKPSGSE